MGTAVYQGNEDGGYDSRREHDAAKVTHSAPWSHEIGVLAINEVAIGFLGPERVPYGRNRVVLPTGFIALSQYVPPMIDQDSRQPDVRHN